MPERRVFNQPVAFTGPVQFIGPNSGAPQGAVSSYAVDGAISVRSGVAFLTKGSAGAYTLASPSATTDDGLTLDIVSQTAQTHTVTCTAGFGGGTTARDVATFGGAINDGFQLVAQGGLWWVKATRNVTIA